MTLEILYTFAFNTVGNYTHASAINHSAVCKEPKLVK